jgi:LDH2 family malate/lactate/ureidoglycolate dehydrogenase
VDGVRFPAGLLEQQARAVLVAWGAPEDTAATVAAVMVDADLSGIDSHGVSMLPGYERLRAQGELALDARPTTVRSNDVTALVDAGGGLGHAVAVAAMEQACSKAAEHGVGAVAVRNSHHFGATGYYARLAADNRLIGLVTSTARTVAVVPTRGTAPRLPTNPLAFAAPAGRHGPFVLDMSTSTVAVNKVKVHGYAARPLPEGWVLDGAGRSVRDPAEAMVVLRESDEGGLTPLGGTADLASHKGYGLAVMVQVLAATLCGASFAALRAPGTPADIGHFFLALDPAAFRDPDEFARDMDELIEELRATPPADPALPVLVAGDPEATAREERARDGVPVPEALRTQLREVSERAGVAFLLDRPAA